MLFWPEAMSRNVLFCDPLTQILDPFAHEPEKQGPREFGRQKRNMQGRQGVIAEELQLSVELLVLEARVQELDHPRSRVVRNGAGVEGRATRDDQPHIPGLLYVSHELGQPAAPRLAVRLVDRVDQNERPPPPMCGCLVQRANQISARSSQAGGLSDGIKRMDIGAELAREDDYGRCVVTERLQERSRTRSASCRCPSLRAGGSHWIE